MKEEEGMELVSRNIDESSNAISSTMRIELRLKCEGLPRMESKGENEKYVVSYKIEHGNSQQVFKWVEKLENSGRPQLSKPLNIAYEMGTDQTTKISITRYEDVKELRDPQHKTPYGSVFMNLNDAIVSKEHEIKKRIISSSEANQDDEAYITLSLAEKKQENLAQVVVQFEIVENRLKGPFYFTCYQHVGDGLKFIAQSENSYADKRKPRIFTFEPLTLSSETFEGAWEEKSLAFHFADGSAKNKAKSKSGLIKEDTRILARASIQIKDLIQSQLEQLPIVTKNKKFGRVVLKKRTVEPILTLGSILFSDVKVIPIIAVDYSLGNLTFDNLKCMHHFDKIRPNLYVEALKQIENRASPFYSKMYAYGFGAKLVPKKSKASSCFALNGNIFDPGVDNKEELLEAYTKTLRKVEVCLPVNYTEVIRTAKGLAQCELSDYRRRYRYYQHNLNSSAHKTSMPALRKYYVLYIVAAGVLDDPEEAYNECENIADLPLSVVFVKIGNQQMRDVDDLADIQKRIEKDFCSKRKFMSLVEFDRIFNDLTNFGKFLISTVPSQILQFLKLAQRQICGTNREPELDEEAKVLNGLRKNTGLEEEEKEELKQQGLDPKLEDKSEEYFEKLKIEYYHKMRETAMKSTEIEQILKVGIADDDPDLPVYLLPKDKNQY